MRRFLAALMLLLLPGCTLRGSRKEPDFARYTKPYALRFSDEAAQGDGFTFRMTAASMVEVYTVIGREHWNVNFEGEVRNLGDRPLSLTRLTMDFESPKTNSGGPSYPHPRDATLPVWVKSAEASSPELAPGAAARVWVQLLGGRGALHEAPFTAKVGGARVTLTPAR